MTMNLWAEGMWPAVAKELAVEETVAGAVWQSQQVMVIDDLRSEQRFEGRLGRFQDHELRSYCVVPLTTLDQRLGALGFGLNRNWVFNPQEVEFLRRAAEILALSIHNAQARQSAVVLAIESGRAHRALQLLREIDSSLASNLTLQQHLFDISSCIQKVIPHDHAGVGICDPDGRSLRVVALDPTLKVMLNGEGECIPLQGKILTQAFLDRATTIFQQADLAAMQVPCAQRALEIGIRSLCCAPMVTANGPMGVLGLASQAEDAFTRQDLNLLKQVSSAIALWMENALTQEAAQKETRRLQVLLEVNATLSQSQSEFRQLFPKISHSVRKIVRHDLALVNLMDGAGGALRVYAWSGAVADLLPSRDAALPLDEIMATQILEPWAHRIPGPEESESGASHPLVSHRASTNGVQSACFVPLLTSVGTIGSLCLARRDESVFVEEDVQFLKRLAPEMALALENTLAHQALILERTRSQTLRQIDSVLFSKLELEKLLPAVSSCLAKVVPHDDFSVFLYDPAVPGLKLFSTDSKMKKNLVPAESVLSLGNTLTGQAFVAQQTHVYDYAKLLRSTSPLAQHGLEMGVRSVCFVPLITPQGALGVMTLSSNTDCAFGVESVDILEQAGASIALTLENALAHRALKREKDRIQVLLGTGSSLAANFDPQHGFPKVSAYMRRLKRHEFASLILLDRANGFYQHILDFPLGKGIVVAESNMSIADSPVEKTLQARTPLIFSREGIAAFDGRFSAGLLQEGMKSLCCIPLKTPKEVLGTLNLGSTREDAFRPDEFGLLTQVATQIAVALQTERTNREIQQLKSRFTQEKQHLEGEIRTEPQFEEIIGNSRPLRRILEQVSTVATSDATVLILGETGTGKELIARAIHRLSLRKQAPFVKVNCAAIPTGLLESELFGHEKGAFTGAVSQKVGRLELADRGTLFLDEVGEIALDLQPKLLRVLQDQEFERLGGTKTTKVNLRLIAATNRDLAKSMAEHEFRSDLFYRLNVFPIRMPALRDRREDIPMLVRYFVRKFASRMKRNIENISSETMQALTAWNWPGNVRELENFMERSVIMSEGSSLRVPLSELHDSEDPSSSSGDTLDRADREHIVRVLRECAGILSGPSGAARRLGLKRTTLQSKMRRLGIARADYAGLQ